MQRLIATAILGVSVLIGAWPGTGLAAFPANSASAGPTDPARRLADLSGLEFRLQPSASLPIRTRIGDTLIFSAQPFSPARGLSAGEPYAVIGPAAPMAKTIDLSVYAEQRISRIPALGGVTDLSGRPLKLDGRPAFELTARARDKTTGKRQRIYQLVVLDGNLPYVVLAVAGDARYPAVADAFQALARSVEITPLDAFGRRIQASQGEP